MAQKAAAPTLKKQLIAAARAAGRGNRTIAKREAAATRYADWLRQNNQQQRQLRDVAKVALVRGWIDSVEAGPRQKQNLMSLLRGTFRAAGFEKFADAKSNRHLTSKALGIDRAPRDGAFRPPTAEEWAQIRARLEARPAYERERVAFELARTIGLRVEEAVQSIRQLPAWERSLRLGLPVRVVHGTKGSRPRDTHVPRALRAEALAAVHAARALCKASPDGLLVAKPTLHQALERVKTVATAVGLVGEITPHGLRYHFAHRLADELRADGYDRASVLAQVSLSLGHGDGRGRFCAQVYLRSYDWGDQA